MARVAKTTIGSLPSPSSTSCPFLFHSQSLPSHVLPALVQGFRGQCPFLSSIHFSKHVAAKLDLSQPSRKSSTIPRFPFKSNVGNENESSTNSIYNINRFQTPQQSSSPLSSSFSAVATAAMTAVDVKPSLAKASPSTGSADADKIISDKMAQLKKEGRYRVFIDIERQRGEFPKAFHRNAVNEQLGSNEVTVWCNNDYLGMGQHPVVLKAMRDSIDVSGAGAGGTRNISGTTPYHTQLERTLALAHEKESALVFTSGYVANDATLTTLGKLLPNCHIFSDALNHASMIEGIKHSGAKRTVFRHNDVQHLRELLQSAEPSAPKLIVFESVYSMDGDIAPIKEICDLADEFNALTYIDEVHAVGLYGNKGGGVAQRDGQSDRCSIISGTMAKGYGVFGGYIAGSALLIDAIRSFASGFIFTSSLPPSVVAACEASVRYLMTSQIERQQHQQKAQQLKESLIAANLPVLLSESHIVPLMIADAKLCKRASDLLLNKYKIYAQPINYPTVPRGTERLRLTPSPLHSQKMIEELIFALNSVWEELSLPRQFNYITINGVIHVERDNDGNALTCCSMNENNNNEKKFISPMMGAIDQQKPKSLKTIRQGA